MLDTLESPRLGQVGRHPILVLDESLSVIQHVFVGWILQSIDLQLAVVAVLRGLEVVDSFEEAGFLLSGKGVAHWDIRNNQ